MGRVCCCCCRSLADRRLALAVAREKNTYLLVRNRNLKTLLLGCDSSGKSTFVKQVKIIEEGSFTEEECKTYKPLICQNIITAAQMLILGMHLYKLQYVSNEVEEYAKMILELEVKEVTELNADLLVAVKSVWKDSGVQGCYKRRDELYLLDSTKYFMKRLDAVAAADYVPTQQDVLRSRSSTTGVSDYHIPLDEYNKNICLLDVGGQRSDRPKWIHFFEYCVVFIFVSAISEYNQLNEHGKNRMGESLALFKMLLGSSAFRFTSVVVFLNKVDIFQEKIKKHHLCHYFREYKGPKKDPEAAKEFFLCKFQKYCFDARKSVYIRYTCATDTENMPEVYSSVIDFITKKMLLRFYIS